MEKRLRFADLVALGIVKNRATLGNWIRDRGFPAGQLTGPNTRTWSEGEVRPWLEGRPITPKPTPSARPLRAHRWLKEPNGHYIEPAWVAERLFAVESFTGEIWDPACGIGRIVEAARAVGLPTFATDLVDRGYDRLDGISDFLASKRPTANVVTNPPFDLCDRFVRHALTLATDKVAMIWLTRRLNAARWLRQTPLARIHLLTPRPSMPPGEVIARGDKPGGGTQDFAWLVFQHSHAGPPVVGWLHRDGDRAPIPV